MQINRSDKEKKINTQNKVSEYKIEWKWILCNELFIFTKYDKNWKKIGDNIKESRGLYELMHKLSKVITE